MCLEVERRWAKVTPRAHAATTSLSQGLEGDTSSQNLQLSQHVAILPYRRFYKMLPPSFAHGSNLDCLLSTLEPTEH